MTIVCMLSMYVKRTTGVIMFLFLLLTTYCWLGIT